MTDAPADPLLYRPAVGIMLRNAAGAVFVGQRIDTVVEAWQMPQGGIDPGETPRDAALRELTEETGIAPDRVEIVAQSARELFYDLPADLRARVWKGRYRGQRQIWFLLRFLGTDADVDLRTVHPEFRAWQWAAVADVPRLIVPFKRKLYEEVLAEFADPLGAA